APGRRGGPDEGGQHGRLRAAGGVAPSPHRAARQGPVPAARREGRPEDARTGGGQAATQAPAAPALSLADGHRRGGGDGERGRRALARGGRVVVHVRVEGIMVEEASAFRPGPPDDEDGPPPPPRKR